jgi:membrane associated rhomboid family serine protease
MSKECDFCGFREPLPFTCKFCGRTFCYAHRLPEVHNCPGLISYKEKVRETGKISSYEPVLIPRKKPINLGFLTNFFSVLRSNYSFVILVIAVISFLLQNIFPEYYTSYFALTPADIFINPLKYMLNLITHMFLHGGGIHLLFNMMFLFFIGPELERRIGSKRFLAVYFISGFIAAIGYTIWSIFIINQPFVSAIGASGALFGIFACLAVLAPHIQLYVYFIPMKITVALIFFALFDLVLIGSGDPIARSAHLSGIIGGLIIGKYIKDSGEYLRG